MTTTNQSLKQKPVIFLAFANDRVRHVNYLRNLPKEHRGIREALDKAKRAGLCEVIERANAAIEDILDVFQDEIYKDRIAIFHYGGHANGYQLLMESLAGGGAPAYKDGLTAFFARQKALKLIFLNGCSTEQHALELKQAGIPAVIGTSRIIDDQVAATLAIRFYHGIANGFSLEQAWREAEDEIKIQVGSANFDAMYHWEHQEKHPDRFPWNIFFKEGAEKVKEWNLPDAVNDSLFGLPSIPQNHPLPERPFLFLNRYREKHAEIFFGRSFYIRQLYHRITAETSPPIILFYGQSGVGKSSLLEAGLLPRLEETHSVIYVRRDREKGLCGTLEEALDGHPLSLKKDIENPTIGKKWKLIEFKARKPLVVIMDQVEEVYTHFNKKLPNEFADFTEALKTLFANPAAYPGGKLILSYRKEYHPEIDKQLGMNELDRTPLFVQPLSREDIIEVVTGLTGTQRLKDKYNLRVEEQLPVIIADDLLADHDSPVAPTLQIVLTKMWDKSKKNEFSPEREFRVKQYQVLRKQGLLMEDFFEQQMEKLRNWKREAVDSGLALDVLKFHTSPLGVSCHRNIEEIRQAYPHRLEIIHDLIRHLKHLYLLSDTRHNRNETGLAHDTLAPIVIKEYNNSDKPGQRASRILAARLEDFKKSPGEIWLNETDLMMVEQGKRGMRVLNAEEEEFLEKSRTKKVQREKQIKRYKTIRTVSMIFIVIFAIFAVWQWKAASDNAKIIKAGYLASQAQLEVEKDPTTALRLAESAWNLDKDNNIKKNLYKIYRENNFYKIIARLNQSIKSAAFSRDGRYIGVSFDDGTSRLWDLQGKELTNLEGYHVDISFDDSSTDVQYNVLRSEEGIVHMWDKRESKFQDFMGHESRIYSHKFSPDGKHFLTGSEDKTARLWDLQGKQLQVFRGHEGRVTSVDFSPDGRYILTVSKYKTLRLWELKDRELRVIIDDNGHVYSAAFSPDSKYILTGSRDGKVGLWDRKGNQLQVLSGYKISVTSVAFSRDSKHILAGFVDGTIGLWEHKGKELWVLKGHKTEVSSIVFSPDGKYVLTASYDKTFRLWDAKGNELRMFKDHKHRVTSAVFSPDGQHILTGSYDERDKTARLWDLQGKEVTVFRGHKRCVTSAVFSPDGQYILTGAFDNTACLWNLAGNELQRFRGHEGIVRVVTFSPEGGYILTGSDDKTARLWDLEGNQLQVFKGHDGAVHSVAFSSDGRYVLTGSFDGTVRLWKIYPLEDFLKNGICEEFSEEQLERKNNS